MTRPVVARAARGFPLGSPPSATSRLAQALMSDGGGALGCQFEDVLRAVGTPFGPGDEVGALRQS
jgi:hypothetical protein